MDDLEWTGNLIEAGFWVVFATAIAIGARNQSRPVRLLGVTASAVSLLFGISDLVEARTGAWWRPWWLLVWKGTCIAALVLCFLKYGKLRCEQNASVGNTAHAPSSPI
jgi:hypothetical protein